MNGLLLDPLTGRPEGRAAVPRRGDEQPWRNQLERAAALDRVRDSLERSRDSRIYATTTTNRYLSYPAAAAGITRATSGGAWTASAYTELVPANGITSQFHICGFTWMWHTPIAAADTTYEVLFDIATGGAGAEQVIMQVPSSYRADTAVGFVPSNYVAFPEPRTVAANTRIAVRVFYSLAAAQTFSGIKILYQIV